jgi:hypothetical protein
MDSIVETDMKIEEYKGYHPFLEEVADIAIKMANRNESFENMAQIHSFCQYFILKGEIHDVELWTNIEHKIEELLPSSSSTDMFKLMELLKRHDLLTSSLSRTLATFTKEHLLGVESEDLAVAMALVCSEYLHDESFTVQLDNWLQGKQLSIFSISAIWKMAVQNIIHLPEFSSYAFSTAMENFDKFTLSELASIAILQIMEQSDLSLAHAIEKRLIAEGRKTKVDDWVELMPLFLYYEAPEEVWNFMDVVIGRNIKMVQPHQITHILESFLQCPFKREKLFTLFIHKIKNSKLSVADYCKILRVYGELQVDNEQIFEILDNKLASKIPVSLLFKI